MSVDNISVLLVESDDILRAIYQRIIEVEVKEVLTAKNGEEGFTLYSSNSPDIIVTDIKLPVINGIDMVKKIRNVDKNVRVVMMSAYVDAKYFIQAIETGVKGFLTKPIDNDKLAKLIRDQVHEILLERQIEEEGRKRRKAERDREKSDNILRVLSETTALFLQHGITDKNLLNAMALIGEATDASRLYIFKKHKYRNKEVISQIYEWVEAGVESQEDNDVLKNIPVNSPFFSRWASILQSDNIIKGNVDTDFTDVERNVLQAQSIVSLLIIPIFVQDEWWGFIGLDECKERREWSKMEINTLRLVANNLGAAFYRKKVEYELLSLNADLETRVKQRTKELEIEVSERKNTEVLLRESEEKYRMIFENANDGIVLANKDGEVLMVNPRMIEIFDMRPNQIIGKHFCSFIDEEYRQTARKALKESTNDQFYSTLDVTNTANNGAKHWLELKPTNILWDGELAFLIFVSEVTLRKNAEYKLNQLNLDLESRIREAVRKVEQQQQLLIQKSKLESMGELAAGLAHEINQPLGGISMGLDNILYKINENELTNEYLISKLEVLFKDIDRIRNIINHVRIFSRDQQNLQRENVAVRDIIEGAFLLIKKQFESEKINLNVHLEDTQYFIYVNPYRIEQVLLNLLSNARYAVNKKSIDAGNKSYVKEVNIDVAGKKDMVLICVEDNGIGMKDEILNKIFDPFFTTKEVESGTGIGLSISYGIIKEANGRIFAQSVPGKSTKVFIELPIIKNNGK